MKLSFIKNWPFPKDMPACLYWVRSPKQIGQSKQWMVVGLFIGENSEPYQFIESWGALPLLKLGAIYVNGRLSDLPATGVERNITLSENVKCEVVSCEKIKNEWFDVVANYNEKYLYERCIRLMDGEKCQLVVPCIEVVRSFLAINAKMSHLLLEPGGLHNICTSIINDNRIEIDFNKEIALNMLKNDVLVNRIVTILYQPGWQNCWQQVWSQFENMIQNSKEYMTIICKPPIAKKCTWHVRGIQTAKGFFVLEILGVKAQTDSPFSEVIWTHPKLTTSEDSSRKLVGGNALSGKTDEPCRGDGEIDSDSGDPKGLNKPNLMPINIATIEFLNSIKITKKRLNRGQNTGGQERKPGGQRKGGLAKPVRVTLNDEGGRGTIEAADFLSIEQQVDIPDRLAKFIEAVGMIYSKKVGCIIKPVPKNSNLVKAIGRKFHYALVHIVTHESARYVLEIESLNEHVMSTLVFSPPKDISGLETAEILLSKCVTASRNWDLAAITSEICERYVLVKHVEKNAISIHWGRKLWAAVNALG